MNTRQKIIVCALAALFILILMCGWGYFAYHGKTDVGVFIAQIGTLITIAVGLITAFAGHQAGRAGQGGSTLLAAGSATLGEFVPPSPPAVPSSPALTVSVSGMPAAPVVPPIPPGASQ
jgi:hypothetical protein